MTSYQVNLDNQHGLRNPLHSGLIVKSRKGSIPPDKDDRAGVQDIQPVANGVAGSPLAHDA